ncbi:MAG: tRNA threonylcarbamoyladenosine dehydratase [Bacteroidaceae bacterium]|nr:tRNA threonylcarbamoyladenosine dehydratase [Bacteroidaceae bacterium]
MENPSIPAIYTRSCSILGNDAMHRLSQKKVIIFGIGGVGSWCAEGLIRTGLKHLTIVDSDNICVTNINRQLMATCKTIGQPKTQVMQRRLLEINPQADITALSARYTPDSAGQFQLDTYDVIIDCIDSVPDKADIILRATQLYPRTILLSSMGAALRTDPTKICVAEFWKVQGDALARALRNRFKRNRQFPAHKFQCVYSEEPPCPNLVQGDGNGSLVHITSIFGMTLSGLALKHLVR